MSMKHKFLLLLIAAGLILSSCQSDEPSGGDTSTTSADTSTVPEETEPTSSLELLGEYDFGGETYTIVGREYAKLGDLPSYEFVTESENGDLINDTVYKRNRIVEDQYNVKLECIQYDNNTAMNNVQKSQMAGDGAYDLVWSHINTMTSMVMKDLLANYYDMPVIDITKPWWNQLATESLTLNDRCYLQMNYIPFTGVMLSHCLYFNKNLAEEYSIGDLYSLVQNDEWTFDRFAELAKQVSQDLDGNGEYDENDLYGLAASHGTSGVAFSIAMGTKPLKVNDDGSFELTMSSERNQNILEMINSLTSDNATYLITDTSLENDLAKLFAESRALFYSGFLTDSYQFFRDMDDDFGLLPFPKYDASQENYITTVTGGTGLLGIPKYVDNPEMVGAVTEALAIESYNYVYPAIYETVFNEKLLRDDESREMFDILMNGLEIDFGRTFKYTAYSDLIGDLVAKGSTDLASSAAALEPSAEKHYSDVIELFYSED